MNPLLERMQGYPMVKLDQRKEELRARGVTVFDFGVGDPVEETPAFIREAFLAAVPVQSQYPTVAGLPKLREAAAGYLERRFGVTLDPSTQILHSSGSKEAVFHLPLAVIDPASAKRVVVMPDPGYPVYERGAQFAQGIVEKVPLRADRGFLLEPADLPAALLEKTALFWTSYPHNPTGAVADRGYYERVVKAAEQHGFLVASDECYVDLWFDRKPASILEVTSKNVLAIHSCSKRSGMTGFRSGFMAGDATLIAALKKLRPSMGVASPEMTQLAAAAAWSDDVHAEERRLVFSKKRDRMLAFLKEKGLAVSWSEGTFFLWIATPQGHTSESYALRLLDEGIVVSPGTFFGAGEGYFRVALVPSLEEIDAAIARWRKVP